MRKVVVVNSTPIIVLREIGRLEMLKELYHEVIIPEAVCKEICVKDAHVLDDCGWISVKTISNRAAKEMFAIALHEGEVEVMILAKELNADLVIIDDGLGRRHAKLLGYTITGTIGVLLKAKSSGALEEVRPVLDDMIRCGFYISGDIYRKALSLADELPK